jgi:hypothetical protein
MDIRQIHKELEKTSESFDKWVSDHEQVLSDYFYGLTGDQLIELGFDQFYYNEIRSSPVYKHYHNNKKLTFPFSFFLTLLGIAAEKMAEVGSGSFAKTLVIDLPDSPGKYRLKALNEFALVEDIRTDYIDKLPLVLTYLDKSRILYEEGTLRPIVDVLAFYYSNAKRVLESAGLTRELEQVKELYQDEDLIAQFPFLGHQILVDLINDEDPFELYVVSVTRGCLEPSEIIRRVFGEFNRNYFNHPYIDHDRDNLWGYTRKEILDDVLVRGRGDFTKSTGKITPDDKVMLYCFFNMKKHFFTSYAVFQNVVHSLGIFFRDPDYKPVFIDLGCGPMTSGLAIGDLLHDTTGVGINMSYLGVDISDAMIDKSKSFGGLDIFSPECYFDFFHNWNDIKPKLLSELAGKNNPIIFNASYLFASDSVNEKDLAKYVNKVCKSFANVYFIFQNPNRVDRNLKYEEFKRHVDYEVILSQFENVRYKATSIEANEDVAYEILKMLNR